MSDWIEEFYADLERKIKGYVRPKDYRERAKRLFQKYYKPVRNQQEGLKKSEFNDNY